MKRVALISLGCAKNLVDSEVMLGYLEQAGYALHPDPETADIIIINTCGFIEAAREEAARREPGAGQETERKGEISHG